LVVASVAASVAAVVVLDDTDGAPGGTPAVTAPPSTEARPMLGAASSTRTLRSATATRRHRRRPGPAPGGAAAAQRGSGARGAGSGCSLMAPARHHCCRAWPRMDGSFRGGAMERTPGALGRRSTGVTAGRRAMRVQCPSRLQTSNRVFEGQVCAKTSGNWRFAVQRSFMNGWMGLDRRRRQR
jgi:hypothetical protein